MSTKSGGILTVNPNDKIYSTFDYASLLDSLRKEFVPIQEFKLLFERVTQLEQAVNTSTIVRSISNTSLQDATHFEELPSSITTTNSSNASEPKTIHQSFGILECPLFPDEDDTNSVTFDDDIPIEATLEANEEIELTPVVDELGKVENLNLQPGSTTSQKSSETNVASSKSKPPSKTPPLPPPKKTIASPPISSPPPVRAAKSRPDKPVLKRHGSASSIPTNSSSSSATSSSKSTSSTNGVLSFLKMKRNKDPPTSTKSLPTKETTPVPSAIPKRKSAREDSHEKAEPPKDSSSNVLANLRLSSPSSSSATNSKRRSVSVVPSAKSSVESKDDFKIGVNAMDFDDVGETYYPLKGSVYRPSQYLPAVLNKEGNAAMNDKDARSKKRWSVAIDRWPELPPTALPKEYLQLDYVYGYRGCDGNSINNNSNVNISSAMATSANTPNTPNNPTTVSSFGDNLFVNGQKDIVYSVSSVAISYNSRHNTQQLCCNAAETVMSMAIHPNGCTIATGHVASVRSKKPKIFVWNSFDLVDSNTDPNGASNRLLAVLEGFHERSVSCLSFSRNGNWLLSVGNDDHNSIAIYDWRKRVIIANGVGHSDKIFVAKFDIHDNMNFVTCGVKHIRFWRLSPSQQPNSELTHVLTYKNGLFQSKGLTSLLAMCFTAYKNQTISGTATGELYLWESNKLISSVKDAHKGPIYTISQGPNSSVISSGKDSKIRFWRTTSDLKLQPLTVLDLNMFYAQSLNESTFLRLPKNNSTSFVPLIHAVVNVVFDESSDFSTNTPVQRLIVGTRNNQIFEIKLENFNENSDDLPDVNLQLIADGHTDEQIGMVTHPLRNLFATCSKDGSVKVWDSVSHKKLKEIWVEESHPLCVCFHPSYKILAVGLNNGCILILQYEPTLVVLQKLEDPSTSTPSFVPPSNFFGNLNLNSIPSAQASPTAVNSVDEIKFSPNGLFLAAGCHDSTISLYRIRSNKKSFKKIGICKGHSSFVAHMDWSQDSTTLQSDSSSYEHLYCMNCWEFSDMLGEIPNCNLIRKSSLVRDQQWATWTCLLGWHVKGIWSNTTVINSVSRSGNGNLVVTANDAGVVKLYRFPAYDEKSKSRDFLGHSTSVSNVRFTTNDECVLSMGGNDKAIFQWKVWYPPTVTAPQNFDLDFSDEDEDDNALLDVKKKPANASMVCEDSEDEPFKPDDEEEQDYF